MAAFGPAANGVTDRAGHRLDKMMREAAAEALKRRSSRCFLSLDVAAVSPVASSLGALGDHF